jgi:hypothetical protein
MSAPVDPRPSPQSKERGRVMEVDGRRPQYPARCIGCGSGEKTFNYHCRDCFSQEEAGERVSAWDAGARDFPRSPRIPRGEGESSGCPADKPPAPAVGSTWILGVCGCRGAVKSSTPERTGWEDDVGYLLTANVRCPGTDGISHTWLCLEAPGVRPDHGEPASAANTASERAVDECSIDGVNWVECGCGGSYHPRGRTRKISEQPTTLALDPAVSRKPTAGSSAGTDGQRRPSNPALPLTAFQIIQAREQERAAKRADDARAVAMFANEWDLLPDSTPMRTR